MYQLTLISSGLIEMTNGLCMMNITYIGPTSLHLKYRTSMISTKPNLVPRPSEREGEGRPCIHCMRMHRITIYYTIKASTKVYRRYPDIIGFSKIWRMMAYLHAVSTRPSFLSPSEDLRTRLAIQHLKLITIVS